MKTTLNIDDQILRNAKKQAARDGITLTALVEEALRARLLQAPKKADYRFHPRVVRGRRPPNVDEALDFARAVAEAPTCRLLTPGSTYLEHFFALVRDADARGNLVFDAQIVALCVEKGVSRVLTNDRDFARFPGVAIEHL